MSVTFDGNSLAWVARTAPWYGIARVTVDGGAPVMVDLYSYKVGWKKTVYNTGLLEAGPHTLLIEWTGEKNAKASGMGVSIDAVDILVLTP